MTGQAKLEAPELGAWGRPKSEQRQGRVKGQPAVRLRNSDSCSYGHTSILHFCYLYPVPSHKEWFDITVNLCL